MKNAEPVVHFCNSLHEELQWRLYSHEKGKEKLSVRQRVTKAVDDEEEHANKHCSTSSS